jgi:hypothetical protein
MANHSQDNPSFEEQTRRNPEFSLGERMATMEANQKKDIEHGKEVAELEEKLVDEKLKGVRQEMATKDTAQKEAIGKAEKAANETAAALAATVQSSRETADARLGALERGGAAGGGEKQGSVDLVTRTLALLVGVGIIVDLITRIPH